MTNLNNIFQNPVLVSWESEILCSQKRIVVYLFYLSLFSGNYNNDNHLDLCIFYHRLKRKENPFINPEFI